MKVSDAPVGGAAHVAWRLSGGRGSCRDGHRDAVAKDAGNEFFVLIGELKRPCVNVLLTILFHLTTSSCIQTNLSILCMLVAIGTIYRFKLS
jgi:hypothetical protein